MGGLKPRAGSALAKCAPRTGGAAWGAVASGLAPGVAAMATEWQTWLQASGQGELEPASVISFNSYGEGIGAALAGHGVALGRRPLVDALLRSRKVLAPFGGERASERGYTLVLAASARARPSVLALAQWLRDEARGTVGR